MSKLKVAIVHDWLYGGGAELVVEQLHQLFPDAPIYTSYCSNEWRQRLDNKVVTGWLQFFGGGRLRKFVPFLRMWWFSRLNLQGYDLVISSSGAEAKGIRVPTGAIHVNYCHAPTHYYWSRYEEYMRLPGFGKLDPLARLGLKLLVGPMRRWDYRAAQRPHYIIANSTHIQAQIKQYYDRDSTVIFPPVYLDRFTKPENQGLPRSGFVISGRLTPYKRFDLAVEACTRLALPLTVIGSGPDRPRLESLAGPTVTFLGHASDQDVERVFGSSVAFIFPGVDDFGITPVEAMAAGTPVIAFRAGGALDYVVVSQTGLFFNDQSVESLMKALLEFKTREFDATTVRSFAQKFSQAQFRQSLSVFLQDILKQS